MDDKKHMNFFISCLTYFICYEKKNNKMFISSEHSHQTVHILFIILIYLHILFIMTVHIIFIIRISYLNKPTRPKQLKTQIGFGSTEKYLKFFWGCFFSTAKSGPVCPSPKQLKTQIAFGSTEKYLKFFLSILKVS